MRKRYVLLKDTPELKAGAIVEEMCDDGDQPYRVISHEWDQQASQSGVQYNRDVVMEQPEWFEEVHTIGYLTKKQYDKLMKLIGVK